ncbi:hypothetical protein [Streptomyces sp. NPDC047718]|uniref:aromatic-ring hydroxylase C-terminal domain-containing protein n=1 Tax=Streptomyces sp. NPDC047718 TaxID=3155479 RepID=UPI0033DE27C4
MPLAGTTEGARRLADFTTTARPLLLDLSGDFAEAAQPWHDRVDVISGKADGTSATGLLLRPDCHIAWTGTEPNDVSGLRAALHQWFGEPLNNGREQGTSQRGISPTLE